MLEHTETIELGNGEITWGLYCAELLHQGVFDLAVEAARTAFEGIAKELTYLPSGRVTKARGGLRSKVALNPELSGCKWLFKMPIIFRLTTSVDGQMLNALIDSLAQRAADRISWDDRIHALQGTLDSLDDQPPYEPEPPRSS